MGERVASRSCIPGVHTSHVGGLLCGDHVPGSDRERDGARGDIQEQGHEEQHQHLPRQPECRGPDDSAGLRSDCACGS